MGLQPEFGAVVMGAGNVARVAAVIIARVSWVAKMLPMHWAWTS